MSVIEKPEELLLIPTLILLVGAGLPFAYAEFSLSSWKALPPDENARQGMELIDEKWPDQAANSIYIVIETDGEDPLSEENLRAQYAYLVELLNDTRVSGGIGVGLPDSTMSVDQVVQFWSTPDDFLSSEQIAVRENLRNSFVGENATLMSIQLKGVQTSVESREMVEQIRNNKGDFLTNFSGKNDELLVAGFAAYNADNLKAISDNLPRALAFILIATLILIFMHKIYFLKIFEWNKKKQ